MGRKLSTKPSRILKFRLLQCVRIVIRQESGLWQNRLKLSLNGDDFHKTGLGSQQCQDCHMPRTLRKSAEDDNVPVRAVPDICGLAVTLHNESQVH